MNSPRGRGHPTEPWHTLKVRPIPYNRVAGQKGDAEAIEKGGAGALEGRVENIAKVFPSERIQHDNPDGRVADMDTEGLVLEPVEEIEETARVALEHGYQLNTHAIGDRANREIGRAHV